MKTAKIIVTDYEGEYSMSSDTTLSEYDRVITGTIIFIGNPMYKDDKTFYNVEYIKDGKYISNGFMSDDELGKRISYGDTF